MQIVTEGKMQPTTCGYKKLKMPRALILNNVSEFARRTSQANGGQEVWIHVMIRDIFPQVNAG